MTEEIFFKSPEHKQRFVAAMQKSGKIYNGKFDPEYGAAYYILTADLSTWQNAQEYVTRDGILIPEMLEEVDLSGGYSVIIQLAGNLFNSRVHVDPVEFMRLDNSNFHIAMSAIQLRRHSAHIDDFK